LLGALATLVRLVVARSRSYSQTQALLHRYLDALLDTGGAAEAQAVPPAPPDGGASDSEGGAGAGFRVFGRVARGAPVVAAGAPAAHARPHALL